MSAIQQLQASMKPAAGPTTPPTTGNTQLTTSNDVTSSSTNLTASSGSNRLLVAWITLNSATATVTACAWNTSETMTFGGRTTGSGQTIEMWYLIAPTAGFAQVDCSYSTTVDAVVDAMSFTGADQTTPFENFAGANGTGTTATVNITSNTGSLVVGGFSWLGANNPPFPAVGADQTLIVEFGYDDPIDSAGMVSRETGASSTTHSYTVGSSIDWIIGAASLKGL